MSSSPKNTTIKWVHCMGDSITKNQGSSGIAMFDFYPSVLQSKLGKPFRARNFGNSGDTSGMMLSRFSVMTNKYIPYIATIECGINDVLQSVSDTTFQSNLTSMITTLQNAGVTKIMLLNIHKLNDSTDTNYNGKRSLIQNIVSTNNVAFCDLYQVSLVSGDYIDNVHLHEGGLAKLATKIYNDMVTLGWNS
jgi:lysophospholipase L1-like esterase